MNRYTDKYVDKYLMGLIPSDLSSIRLMCGANPHLSIRHTKGRIAQQYQFHRKPWLCVLSQLISAWCAVAQ